MKVQAKGRTLKVGGKYRVPGTTTAVFDTAEAKLSDAQVQRLIDAGMVERVADDKAPRKKSEKGAVSGKQPKSTETDSDRLPEDFPGYAALQKAGITTFSALAEVEDLVALDGIGETTAAKIEEELAARADGDA